MTPQLALIVWFFVILIILFIFWWFSGCDAWQSLAAATLISLFVLIILYPWDLNDRGHHSNDKKDKNKKCFNYNWIFGLLVLISLVILVAYIVSTFCY